jgi:hypothetical protein
MNSLKCELLPNIPRRSNRNYRHSPPLGWFGILQFLVGVFDGDHSTTSPRKGMKILAFAPTIEMEYHAHARSFPAVLHIGKPVQTTYE